MNSQPVASKVLCILVFMLQSHLVRLMFSNYMCVLHGVASYKCYPSASINLMFFAIVDLEKVLFSFQLDGSNYSRESMLRVLSGVG